LKLLFADDERTLQELMRIELDRMGHKVTVCPDGLTAVAALEREGFAVRVWPAQHHFFGGVSLVTPNDAAGDPRRSGAAARVP